MRHFLVILGITVLVWTGLTLSDRHTYTMDVQVEYVGYDTAAFAMRRADSVVTVRVESNGFGALSYGMSVHPPVRLLLPEGGNRRSIAFADVAGQFLSQLGVGSSITSSRDSLRVQLVAREARRLKVDYTSVRFSFARRYGLYGQALLQPDSITLYGPADQLASIDRVSVCDTALSDIDSSCVFLLPLAPVWEHYSDVHPSAQQVQLTLQVERFMEHRYKVPVAVQGADTNVLFRLYPSAVELRVWVADCDADMIDDSRFAASINYSDVLQGRDCMVNIDAFPAQVRPIAVEPAMVQCVAIK